VSATQAHDNLLKVVVESTFQKLDDADNRLIYKQVNDTSASNGGRSCVLTGDRFTLALYLDLMFSTMMYRLTSGRKAEHIPAPSIETL
jgi:hypothetical protein